MDERGLRRPDGGAIRVLVVDDESSLSDLLSMALRYEGWDVRAAAIPERRSSPRRRATSSSRLKGFVT